MLYITLAESNSLEFVFANKCSTGQHIKDSAKREKIHVRNSSRLKKNAFLFASVCKVVTMHRQ